MPDEDRTSWLTKKVQLWILLVTAVTTTVGAVYGAGQYLNKFATNEDVATVQMQFNELYYQTQIDGYQEQVIEIQDKIIDGTATVPDKKKQYRLNRKIEKLENGLQQLRNHQ